MVEQLYVAPDGSGRASVAGSSTLAKTRRPDGLDLVLLRRSTAGRGTFYERNGFEAVAFGDGSGNEERPAGRPLRLAAGAVGDRARRRRRSVAIARTARRSRSSRPGTGRRSSSSTARPPITRRSGSSGRCSRRDVHDPRHRPARSRRVGRHGRPYAIEREFEDVAAVAEALAAETGAPVDVVRALVRRPVRARRGPADRRDPPGHLVRGRADPARHRATTPRPRRGVRGARLDAGDHDGGAARAFMTRGRRA